MAKIPKTNRFAIKNPQNRIFTFWGCFHNSTTAKKYAGFFSVPHEPVPDFFRYVRLGKTLGGSAGAALVSATKFPATAVGKFETGAEPFPLRCMDVVI